MGGKGARRREKNYEAAHGGGHTRLPPPPDPSASDLLPSKLRKLMSFAEAASAKKSVQNSTDKEIPSRGQNSTNATGTKRKRNDQNVMAEKVKLGHDASQNSSHDKKKKKKKKKRKAVVDHRFDEKEETAPVGSQRKERKKQRLEARKKKSKKARADAEADLGFRGHEDIKFGDVVQAPPKLVVPKAFKTNQVASQERLRLQAVEAYRQRKGWASRPGGELPAAPVNDASF